MSLRFPKPCCSEEIAEFPQHSLDYNKINSAMGFINLENSHLEEPFLYLL